MRAKQKNSPEMFRGNLTVPVVAIGKLCGPEFEEPDQITPKANRR